MRYLCKSGKLRGKLSLPLSSNHSTVVEQFHKLFPRKNSGENGQQRESLVIVGTGWAGYSLLKNIDASLFNITVVSVRNHFLFTPLLASTTVGTLEFRSIIEPVRNTGLRSTDHFYLSRALDLNTERRELDCQCEISAPPATYTIPYDRLVIAVGALTNTFGILGADKYAYFLKEISDARVIRMKILSNFELASQPNVSKREKRRLLHTVIVGGGPTGVEFGSELYDFVEQDVSRIMRPHVEDVRVTLIEGAKILSSFDDTLRVFAEKKIKQRDRFELIKAKVIEVGKDFIKLEDGRSLPCGLVVWSTGLAARAFTRTLNVAKSGSGQILTDEYLAVQGCGQSVFAIGDCADIESNPLPCTAQVAEREGRYLAKALARRVRNQPVSPFKFTNVGMLAYIGKYQGVSDLPEVKLKGIFSWVLWRSAYLTRLGSWRLRMQVPIDWFKTFFFGRDTSRF